MASEILSVPEEHLQDVIKVIRCGLEDCKYMISSETRKQLKKWCDDEEKYLKKLSSSD